MAYGIGQRLRADADKLALNQVAEARQLVDLTSIRLRRSCVARCRQCVSAPRRPLPHRDVRSKRPDGSARLEEMRARQVDRRSSFTAIV
jgi:hypothetical protein